MLGFQGDVHSELWAKPELPTGQALGTPIPLFDKLDETNLEEESERLGNAWVDPEGPVAQQGPQERVVIFENRIRTRKDLSEEWA